MVEFNNSKCYVERNDNSAPIWEYFSYPFQCWSSIIYSVILILLFLLEIYQMFHPEQRPIMSYRYSWHYGSFLDMCLIIILLISSSKIFFSAAFSKKVGIASIAGLK